MKNKNVFKKGDMGQAGEKWDKSWGEVGQIRLSGLAVKKNSARQCGGRPGSGTVGPHMVIYCGFRYLASQQVEIRPQQETNHPRQVVESQTAS